MKKLIGNATLAGGAQVGAMVVTAVVGSWVVGLAVLVVGLWVGFSLLK